VKDKHVMIGLSRTLNIPTGRYVIIPFEEWRKTLACKEGVIALGA
jgi:hypothetical protein